MCVSKNRIGIKSVTFGTLAAHAFFILEAEAVCPGVLAASMELWQQQQQSIKRAQNRRRQQQQTWMVCLHDIIGTKMSTRARHFS